MVVAIITCSKNKDKMAAIRATWIKDLIACEIPYYFIVGDPSLNECKIEKDILYVPCADVYEGLLSKVCYAYKYIIDHTSYDHVYKVDDDCFVNAALLYATNFWKFNYFGRLVCTDESQLRRDWHFGKCSNTAFNQRPYSGKYYGAFCGGGYGYFLSRKAMIEVTAAAFTDEDILEDKAIGDLLRSKGIVPEKNIDYIAEDVQELNSNNTKRSVFVDFVIQRSAVIYRAVVLTEIRKNYQFLYLQDKKKLLSKITRYLAKPRSTIGRM